MIYRLLSRNSINIGVFTMFPYKPGQMSLKKYFDQLEKRFLKKTFDKRVKMW